VSQENAAVVRGYYETLTRVLDGYAGDGAPLQGSPFVDELFTHVHPDGEWRT
jgi:hypothetical protein